MSDEAKDAQAAFKDAWDKSMAELAEDLVRQCARIGADPAWFDVGEAWIDEDDNLHVKWVLNHEAYEASKALAQLKKN